MKKLVFVSLLAVFSISVNAQLPPKIENEALFGKGSFYLEQLPVAKPYKGVLVLAPGYAEHPYSVTAQSTIVQEAIKNNLAVIMVSVSRENDTFPLDKSAQKALKEMIFDFYKKRNIDTNINLFLGGFSIGGTCILSFFTENQSLKVAKIFAIDPPLDMLRLKKTLQKGNDKALATKFDAFKQNGKSLDESLRAISVYYPEITKENLANYQQTELRIYCEPDILWWMKNRRMDLYDINVIDCDGYINRLLKDDSANKVELILTQDKGFRNGKQKHPHSWSIAEPTELVKWLLTKN